MSALRRTRARGAAYVEVLVIVGIVLVLGLLAVSTLGTASTEQATKEASCIKSFACGGGAASGSQNLASMVGNPSPAAAASSSNPVWDFAKGFIAEGVETVVGTYEAIRHPVQTAQGIGYVAQHPGQAWDAIAAEWKGRGSSENWGRGILEAVTMIGPASITKVAKAAEIAATLGKAAEVAKVAEAARVAETAAEAARVAEAVRIAEAARVAEAAAAARTAEAARVAESAPRLTYEASPKHGAERVGNIAAAPKNGEAALERSVQVKDTSTRRVGTDGNELVVFDETHPGQGIFHGHVRTWEELSDQQRNALTRSGMTDRRGRIQPPAP